MIVVCSSYLIVRFIKSRKKTEEEKANDLIRYAFKKLEKEEKNSKRERIL